MREDLVKKTTKYLLDGGVNLVELYNEMMILSGNEEEVIDVSSGRVQCARCYPSGRIMVRDNSSNTDVPVKNVKVKAKRYAKIKSAYTDNNGYFSINKGFRHKAKVIVKFKNDYAVPWAPFNGSFSRGWIPWGMHHDLIDTGEPSVTLITDQVSGYTINGIFKGFHQGSTTVQNLKAAILANNGNSQAAQVNTLVSGYDW